MTLGTMPTSTAGCGSSLGLSRHALDFSSSSRCGVASLHDLSLGRLSSERLNDLRRVAVVVADGVWEESFTPIGSHTQREVRAAPAGPFSVHREDSSAVRAVASMEAEGIGLSRNLAHFALG
jgi:hypothetical protein